MSGGGCARSMAWAPGTWGRGGFERDAGSVRDFCCRSLQGSTGARAGSHIDGIRDHTTDAACVLSPSCVSWFPRPHGLCCVHGPPPPCECPARCSPAPFLAPSGGALSASEAKPRPPRKPLPTLFARPFWPPPLPLPTASTRSPQRWRRWRRQHPWRRRRRSLRYRQQGGVPRLLPLPHRLEASAKQSGRRHRRRQRPRRRPPRLPGRWWASALGDRGGDQAMGHRCRQRWPHCSRRHHIRRRRRLRHRRRRLRHRRRRLRHRRRRLHFHRRRRHRRFRRRHRYRCLRRRHQRNLRCHNLGHRRPLLRDGVMLGRHTSVGSERSAPLLDTTLQTLKWLVPANVTQPPLGSRSRGKETENGAAWHSFLPSRTTPSQCPPPRIPEPGFHPPPPSPLFPSCVSPALTAAPKLPG